MVANAAVTRQTLATMFLPSLIPFFPPNEVDWEEAEQRGDVAFMASSE